MDRVKFVLINPTSPLWRARRPRRPRGPRVFRFSMLPSLYVAAAMPSGVETTIIDEDIEPIDYDIDADLIGISFMTFNAPRAYEIADRFRRDKGKPVIVGGYHPTFMPDEALQHADAVCVGEAEGTVARLVADFVAGRLQPVYRSELADLEALPIPDRSLLRQHAYITPHALQATRGCPYRCKFCSVAAFHQYRIRTRPVGHVIDELRQLGRTVVFMDDNIIGSRDYAVELFTAMLPLRKRWFSQCGIQIAADEELLELAVQSGCRGLFIGFESLMQQNLTDWRKKNRADDYARLVRRLHDRGVGIYAGFVFGSDSDTPEVFGTTLDFLLAANIDALQATRLTPFPGTALFTEMDREGRIFDKDWGHYDFAHVVFEPRRMTRETLDRGTAWVLRQFYARRRVARRWLAELRYLGPTAFTRVSVPLNLGYRHRLSTNGTFRLGDSFVPPDASGVTH